jgi:hypothetical protein
MEGQAPAEREIHAPKPNISDAEPCEKIEELAGIIGTIPTNTALKATR